MDYYNKRVLHPFNSVQKPLDAWNTQEAKEKVNGIKNNGGDISSTFSNLPNFIKKIRNFYNNETNKNVFKAASPYE